MTGLLARWLPSLRLYIVFHESTAVGFLCVLMSIILGRAGKRRAAVATSQHSVDIRQLNEVGTGGCPSPGSGDLNEHDLGQDDAPALAARDAFFSWSTLRFLVIVLSLGLGEGINSEYTYVRLGILPHGTTTVMGVGAVCMIASEIPFFYYAGPLSNHFGVMPILAIALICMSLRQAWISILWDAWWVMPGELLHGITYSVANAVVIFHCNEIASAQWRATAQSIIAAVFNGFGQGGVALIGAEVIKHWGVVELFRAASCFALCSSGLPMLLSLKEFYRRRST